MDEILSGMINKQPQYLIGEVSQIHSSEGLMFLKLKYNATSYTIFNTPPITKGADNLIVTAIYNQLMMEKLLV